MCIRDSLEELDLVLIMSVNPGYGGQEFITNSYKKISQLRKMIDNSKSKALIQVDGGVTTENAKKLYDAGVDVFVAGSSIFKSENPKETIKILKNI